MPNRVVVVTGGSRGIGRAIVESFATDGAAVHFTYVRSSEEARRIEEESQSRGHKVFAHHCDFAIPGRGVEFAKGLIAKGIVPQVLIANAGENVIVETGELDSGATARRLAQVNVLSVVELVETFAPVLPPGARIVCIGSAGVVRARRTGIAHYVASKSALAGYVRGWARDFGTRSITVNAVHPGPIATEMAVGSGQTVLLAELTALGRLGRPCEIAFVVAFLASDGASYITGTALNVDGGLNA